MSLPSSSSHRNPSSSSKFELYQTLILLPNPLDLSLPLSRIGEAETFVGARMAFMAVLEADLRALSAEARRRYPAEHAILKLRSLSSPSEIAQNKDIVRIFLMACDVKSVKLSVIGLSCLQKLISHDAVAPSALTEILSTLKDLFV